MKRRAVLALLAGATMPLPFAAGEPSKVFRLGMLSFTPPGPGIRALEQRLQTLGWQEGRNLQIDFVRLDETDADRSLTMAAELVGRGVDAIFAGGPELAIKAAVTATRTVPVVMVANDYDPVARGYVASLARPGGNVTGVFMQQIELTPKRLQFLEEAVPDPGSSHRQQDGGCATDAVTKGQHDVVLVLECPAATRCLSWQLI